MQHFIGTYECKADAKGRIMLPAALKKQLSNHLNKSFVIKRAVFNTCLELYPLDQWGIDGKKLTSSIALIRKTMTLSGVLLPGLNCWRLIQLEGC